LFDKIKVQIDSFPLESIPETKNALRFLTHLILLLRNLELDHATEKSNQIILKYIELLQSQEYVY
jgi:hypothetical protein